MKTENLPLSHIESQPGTRPLIKKGQQIHLLPQWQDEGDDKLQWFAYDDEDGGRVGIFTPHPEMYIQPWQMVDVSMLEEGQ